MNTKPYSQFIGKSFNRLEFYLRGAIAVYYFGYMIALINEQGLIKWHNTDYPLYLIEYLLTIPSPEGVKRN